MSFKEQVKDTYLFNDLSQEEIDFLNSKSTEIEFSKGDVVYKQGSYSTHAFYLLDGFIKVYYEKGKTQRIVKIIKPFWFAGLMSVFSYEKHDFTAAALTKVKVQQIEKNALKQVLEGNKEFSFKFIKEISLLGTNLTRYLVLQNTKNVRGRIAEILIHLSENIFRSNIFHLGFTRAEIGDLANTSTETAIRILNDFRNEGLIEISNKEVHIKKIELLKKVIELA